MKLIKGKVKSEVTGSNTSGAMNATKPTNAQLVGADDGNGKMQSVLTARADSLDRTSVLAVVPGYIDGSGNVTMARGAVAAPDGTLLVGAQGIYALNASNTWDKLRSVNTGQLVVTQKSSAGLEPYVTTSVGALGDAWAMAVAGFSNASLMYADNGTTRDKWRNNIPWVTPLISAARTVSAASGTIRNYNHSRLMARLNVTSAGTGTLSLRVRQTVLSGAAVALNDAVTVATAAGWVWELGPGIATTVPAGGAVVQRTLASLPPEFDLYVVSSDGSSWTYSLEYVLML